MKAARFEEKGGNLKIVDLPLPQPSKGQVRIKVGACGVCHTDVFAKYGSTFPRIPGHEAVGRVDALGEGVTSLKVGDRIGVGWFGGSCHECHNCVRENAWVSCPKVVSTGGAVDGGFATHMVANADACALIPEGLTNEEAAPLLCAGITTFNALRNSKARAPDVVAVVGIGALGHLGLQYAAKLGFTVVAVSRGSDKKDLALKLGAKHFIDTSASNAVEELKKLGGAKVILDTSGNAKLIAELANGLGYQGELILAAIVLETIPLSGSSILMKRASIKGWASGDARDSRDTMDFSILTGVRSVNEVFPFERIQEAFDRMASTKAQFKVVVKIADV